MPPSFTDVLLRTTRLRSRPFRVLFARLSEVTTMKYRIGFSACAVLILAVVSSCALAQETVNYGIQPTMAPIHVARAMGLMEPIEKKHNIKIAFRMFQTGPIENAALAAGELQVASAGMGPAIIAASRLPATLVAITVLGQSAMLVQKDSQIKSVADLKGKKVAHGGEGTQQYPMLIKALADAGLKHTDVVLFKTAASQIPTLLQGKSVDAGITFDPFVSNAIVEGYARVLITADQIMPIMQGHYIGNGEYVRDDFLKRHPEIVQDLVDANVQAIEFILKDPKAASKLWAKEIGMPENVIAFSLSNRISVYSRNVAPEKKGIDTYVNFLRDGKILESGDVPKIDSSFGEKALARK
ncbi:MAG: ABC transporter substrate-binding protein [Betaproteobacteria bacterium]